VGNDELIARIIDVIEGKGTVFTVGLFWRLNTEDGVDELEELAGIVLGLEQHDNKEYLVHNSDSEDSTPESRVGTNERTSREYHHSESDNEEGDSDQASAHVTDHVGGFGVNIPGEIKEKTNNSTHSRDSMRTVQPTHSYVRDKLIIAIVSTTTGNEILKSLLIIRDRTKFSHQQECAKESACR
jgi:hypothetical protein